MSRLKIWTEKVINYEIEAFQKDPLAAYCSRITWLKTTLLSGTVIQKHLPSNLDF